MEPSFYATHFAAEDWDWWHVGRRRCLAKVLAIALRRAGLHGRALDVVDVGCGTGGTTAWLVRELATLGPLRVTGCDVAPEALALSRRRGLDPLVLARASALPVEGSTRDLVLALDVLEHEADDARVASEAFRVLRPGGLFLATVPAFDILWGPHDVVSHHHRRYRLPQLRAVLRTAGFEVSLATYFNTLLFPGVLAVQVARRILRRGAAVAPASDLPERMPRWVNGLVREVFASERHWLPRALPFGVSALAIGRRPAAP